VAPDFFAGQTTWVKQTFWQNSGIPHGIPQKGLPAQIDRFLKKTIACNLYAPEGIV
jgi:hypothetical protein